MCGRDVNIEISETYQTGIFFSALSFLHSFTNITPLDGVNGITEVLRTRVVSFTIVGFYYPQFPEKFSHNLRFFISLHLKA